jgi:multicomponent Na+:H+ antiporter subunit E
LLLEIAKANLHVARVILTPSLPIQPRVIRIRATQRSELGNTIFANSITLTPGTVALDVRGGSILVHALTDQAAAGLVDGVMDSRVSRVEGVGDRE